MTIKGLTDGTAPARLPRVGKLRKGGAKGQSGYGPDLDYFRFVSDRPEVVAAFHDAYGKEPKELEVLLIGATPNEAFPTAKEKWTATVLEHRCDGERTSIWYDRPRGVYVLDPARQIACPGGCKEIGKLNVILPRLLSAGYVGVVEVETHSVNDLLNIHGALQMYGASSDLSQMVWTLYRAPEMVSVPTDKNDPGKRARVKKSLLFITPSAMYVRRQLATGLMSSGTSAAMLPDGLIIEGEFKDEIPFAQLPAGTFGNPPEEDDDGYYEPVALPTPSKPVATVKPPPAKVEPPSHAELLAKYRAMITPGGKKYGDLTVDQLKVVTAQAKDATAREAANYLLEAEPSAPTWDAYMAAVQALELAGLPTPEAMPDGVSNRRLAEMAAELRSQIPAE